MLDTNVSIAFYRPVDGLEVTDELFHAVERPGVGAVAWGVGRVGMGFHEQTGDPGRYRCPCQHRYVFSLSTGTVTPAAR